MRRRTGESRRGVGQKQGGGIITPPLHVDGAGQIYLHIGEKYY